MPTERRHEEEAQKREKEERSLIYARVQKRIEGLPGQQARRGGRDPHLQRGGVHRLHRHQRQRKDHLHTHDQPHDGADERNDPPERTRHRDHGRGAAAPPDRLRDPADRPDAPHDDLRERHAGPQPSEVGQGAPARHGKEAHEARGTGRELSGALPRGALRRAAAARGRHPGAGRGPRDHPDGRALRRARPHHARLPPTADQEAPEGAGEDRRLRHPRHGRGPGPR